jgi:hypothetical protein
MMMIIPLVLLIEFLLIKVFNLQTTNVYDEVSFSLIIGSLVLTNMLLVKHVVPLMLDQLIKFHKTYNAKNVNKLPIRLFVYQRNKIILAYNLVFLFGSFVMLYCLFFSKSNF